MRYYEGKGIENFKRCLSAEELECFFEVIKANGGKLMLRDYLFFMLQYVLAGRISEIVRIQVSDIDVVNCSIAITRMKHVSRIVSRKVMPLPKELVCSISSYVLSNRYKIESSGGFLFPCNSSKSQKPHVCPNTMNIRFRKYLCIAGLDMQYFVRQSDGAKLPMVRPHTLRATSINRILEATDGNIVAAMSHSHHKSLLGIMPYLEAYNAKKLEKVQRHIFSDVVCD